MKEVAFGTLKEGDVFTKNGKEFRKAAKQKISCCKFVNAVATNNVNDKVGFTDQALVTVTDSETA